VLKADPMEGIVLRYGVLYGHGTARATPAKTIPVHVDAAAYAALRAVDHGGRGIYNIAEPNPYIATEKARDELGWMAEFRLLD
jgi:nucleoside-diphosphate-sugar epimerase